MVIKRIIKNIIPSRIIPGLIKAKNLVLHLIDLFVFSSVIFIVSPIIKGFRRKGSCNPNMPYTKKIFLKVGVFPIVNHYYEPQFNPKYIRKSLREDRYLPGIEFNDKEQLILLNKFNYNEELLSYPRQRTSNILEFSYDYGAYPSGDSEILYSMIRLFKPKKIIEVGCGSSTLMALNAIKKNEAEDKNYNCAYTCVEPYEQDWLEKTGLKVIRKRVEELTLEIFLKLKENDILFIDSSHIIKPQGDVLFEILEILPSLNSGVLVHFHDIATPKDYFDEWIYKDIRFWNEQYLLEAFLSNNKDFKIILTSNYLFHHYYEQFISKTPILKIDRETKPEREAGSFWIEKK